MVVQVQRKMEERGEGGLERTERGRRGTGEGQGEGCGFEEGHNPQEKKVEKSEVVSRLRGVRLGGV